MPTDIPIGPGTPAWDAADDAIEHGISGNTTEMQDAIDRMTRELIATGASSTDIRQWETYVAERIASPDDPRH